MLVKKLYTPPKVEFEEVEYIPLLAGTQYGDDKTNPDPDWVIDQEGGDNGDTDDDGFIN